MITDEMKEIYKNLSEEKFEFGTFHKACFHIHTPASHDYTLIKEWTEKNYFDAETEDIYNICLKRNVFPSNFEVDTFTNNERFEKFEDEKEILSYLLLAHELLANKIEIAVIADHNTIEGLSKIKIAINELYRSRRNFYQVYTEIINGVEISCADRNHVVVMFEEDKFTNKYRDVNAWLEEHLMSEKDGTYLTSSDVLKHFNNLGHISYIAHINTSDMFKVFNKPYKHKVFENNKYNFVGVSDIEKINYMKDKVKLITKKDVNVILDNDSHNIEDLKVNNFLIKGRKCNFKMIKEALIDFDISISYKEKELRSEINYIKGIYISNFGDNFLSKNEKDHEDPFILKFSESLNCLIGGRGTGKSTVLNILEFALSGKVIDEKNLDFICKHGNIWILYQYNSSDYLIRRGVPRKDRNNSILDRFGQFEYDNFNDRYKFDSQKVQNFSFDNHLKIYKVENGNTDTFDIVKLGKAAKKKMLKDFFNVGYSVNELVNTAGSDQISSFIQDILLENEKLGKLPKRWRASSKDGFIKKLREVTDLLEKRNKEVKSIISAFNNEQKDILKVNYSQNLLNYKINMEKWLFNGNILRDRFYKLYNIKQQSIVDMLNTMYNKLGPIEFLLKIIKGEIRDDDIDAVLKLRERIDIEEDENVIELDESNAKKFLETVYFDLFNATKYNEISIIIEQIFNNLEIYSLEFNINSKEDSRDLPVIYKDVKVLSLGQKVVAMLTFILGYSEYSGDYRPLIIDQPEDNLDTRFIYKNLVKMLRETKEKRQVIVATHNATIVTNAKAEQVCIMESNGKNGWIKKTGYPGESRIKTEIINYLEGGKESFLHKIRIYEEVLNEIKITH